MCLVLRVVVAANNGDKPPVIKTADLISVHDCCKRTAFFSCYCAIYIVDATDRSLSRAFMSLCVEEYSCFAWSSNSTNLWIVKGGASKQRKSCNNSCFLPSNDWGSGPTNPYCWKKWCRTCVLLERVINIRYYLHHLRFQHWHDEFPRNINCSRLRNTRQFLHSPNTILIPDRSARCIMYHLLQVAGKCWISVHIKRKGLRVF
jgi:hypothetical protein